LQEFHERAAVAGICGSKRGDVMRSKLASCQERAAAPLEPLAAQLSEKQIGHEPCVAAVPIGENVHCDQPMVVAIGDFFRWIGAMFS
jgi:hypothetical protein